MKWKSIYMSLIIEFNCYYVVYEIEVTDSGTKLGAFWKHEDMWMTERGYLGLGFELTSRRSCHIVLSLIL